MTPDRLPRGVRPPRGALPVLLGLLLGVMSTPPAHAAAAADDILTSARESAGAGRRPEALAALESHLTAVPRDVDARLLYGLILSWEGRYGEARHELQQVLAQTPGYTDARVALMNVEWWAEDTSAAGVAADAILAQDPGNQSARHVRDQLDAASRPWWVGITYGNDSFRIQPSGLVIM